MTLRYNEKLRNAGLDARIAAIGPAPDLHIFGDGEKTPLVTMTLPKEWMTKASGGIAQKKGLWVGIASKSGKAQSFQLCNSEGECVSGKIPFDMKLDEDAIEKGQGVMVGTFAIAAGNG